MIVAVTTVKRGLAWLRRSTMGGEKHERLAEAAQGPAIDMAKRGTLRASPPSNQDSLSDPPRDGLCLADGDGPGCAAVPPGGAAYRRRPNW